MAEPVRLKIAIADYGHTRALKSGEVPIKGVAPDFVEVKPIIGAFRRMVRDVEFDVCEMAPTTYMIARALGAPFMALPVFLMRRFHHGGFVVRPEAGIKAPKDLEGKKVGVRAYSVTTGVWTRGIFINEYGLDSSKVTWVVDDEEHVTTLKLPPNVGLVVVRSEVLWKHPFVARALYDAFVAAKAPYIAQLKGGVGDDANDKKYRGLMPLVGDPLPYGMAANMPSIEAMLTYGLQQKLIPKRMSLDDAFMDPEAK